MKKVSVFFAFLLLASVFTVCFGQQQPKTKTYKVNNVSFTMVYVEGGETVIGCTSEQQSFWSEMANKAVQVSLDSYWIGQTEVTQELWEAVMGDNPSENKDDPKMPVTKVSWDDCMVFLTRLSGLTGERFRMLTEAEWEYAARGGMYSQYYKYSGSNDPEEIGWFDRKTHPVATKKPNELGLYDMTGNVSEWCKNGGYNENWDYLPGGKNPQGRSATSTGYAIVRGGNYSPTGVSYRECRATQYKYTTIGLRIARDVKKVYFMED